MARVLPMFPLGTVLFPRAALPLHVFEPRYRVMVHDCLRGDREFGVVLIERGSEVGGGDARFGVGTVAAIVRSTELPDGRYVLAAVGLHRLRVIEWLADDPYPRAEIDDIVEPAPDARAVGLRDATLAALGRVHEVYRRIDPETGALPEFSEDPTVAAFEVASAAPLGPLDAQRVLELDDASARLELLVALLDDHVRLVRGQLGDEP